MCGGRGHDSVDVEDILHRHTPSAYSILRLAWLLKKSSLIDESTTVAPFQVYNRFGAARLSRTARLKNTLGGCEGDAAGRSSSTSSSSSLPTQQRYRKVAVDWKSEMLGHGVQQARAWLESRPPLLQLSPEVKVCQGDGGRRLRRRFDRFVVLDVLVPTVRCVR